MSSTRGAALIVAAAALLCALGLLAYHYVAITEQYVRLLFV
jgi:hypothetical protein